MTTTVHPPKVLIEGKTPEEYWEGKLPKENLDAIEKWADEQCKKLESGVNLERVTEWIAGRIVEKFGSDALEDILFRIDKKNGIIEAYPAKHVEVTVLKQDMPPEETAKNV